MYIKTVRVFISRETGEKPGNLWFFLTGAPTMKFRMAGSGLAQVPHCCFHGDKHVIRNNAGLRSGFPLSNEPWMYQKQIRLEVLSLYVKLRNFRNQIWDPNQKRLACKIRRIKPSKQNLVTRKPGDILLFSKQRHRPMKLEALLNSDLSSDLGKMYIWGDTNGNELVPTSDSHNYYLSTNWGVDLHNKTSGGTIRTWDLKSKYHIHQWYKISTNTLVYLFIFLRERKGMRE